MAKKEWRLTSEQKSAVASAIQEYLSERDPSVASATWHDPLTPNESYGRRERYARLIHKLPALIFKDIEYKMSEATKASLKSREDEVTRREEALKKSAEEDRKRDAELAKRERESDDRIRGKDAALALGEAEIARFKAQMKAEMAICQSSEFRGRGGFMMTPWGPMGAY